MKATPSTSLLTFLSILIVSSSGISQWKSTNGTVGQVILSFGLDGQYIYAGAQGGIYDSTGRTYLGGAFRSSDNGANWVPVDSGLKSRTLAPPYVRCFAFSTPNMLAGTNNAIFYSTNNGTSWTRSDSGIAFTNGGINTLLAQGQNVYAGTDVQVLLSTDHGISWHSVSSGLPTKPSAISLYANGQNLLLGTVLYGIYRSTNGGINWAHCDSSSNAAISCFAGSGARLYAGTYYGGVYLSSDSGTSWRFKGIDTTGPSIYSLADYRGTIFASSNFGNVYRSVDLGATWTDVSTSVIQGRAAQALFISGEYLVAGTDTGVFIRPLSEITLVPKRKTHLSMTYRLDQNFPNPFNPSTTISFEIPLAGYTTLKAHDLLGREVATLLSGNINAGRREVSWNANKVSSGVYIYRLVSGSFTLARKLVVVK